MLHIDTEDIGNASIGRSAFDEGSCSVLQCVAMCCSVLQCVAHRHRGYRDARSASNEGSRSVMQCGAVCSSV